MRGNYDDDIRASLKANTKSTPPVKGRRPKRDPNLTNDADDGEGDEIDEKPYGGKNATGADRGKKPFVKTGKAPKGGRN